MARIMIADDSMVMRRIIRGFLEAAGHQIVCEANSGDQACSYYARFEPDLVTMDINMPKMDGVEAVGNIVANHPQAKIIMISALNQKSMVLAALDVGAKHYLIKPVTSEKLLYVVHKVLKES